MHKKRNATLGFLPFFLGLICYLFHLSVLLPLLLVLFTIIVYPVRKYFEFESFQWNFHLLSLMATLLTFYSNKFFIPSVPLNAALVCLFMVFAIRLFKKSMSKSAEVYIYAGTFVGMSSFPFFDNPLLLAITGYLVGVLVDLSKKDWSGYGGKLGTLAFLAVYIVYMSQNIWRIF